MRGGVGPLFLATLTNDTEAMEALIKHGAEVNLENVFQMTPLMIAAGMRARGGDWCLQPGAGTHTRTIKNDRPAAGCRRQHQLSRLPTAEPRPRYRSWPTWPAATRKATRRRWPRQITDTPGP